MLLQKLQLLLQIIFRTLPVKKSSNDHSSQVRIHELQNEESLLSLTQKETPFTLLEKKESKNTLIAATFLFQNDN